MKLKSFALTAVALSLLLAACGSATPTAAPKPTEAPKPTAVPPTAAPAPTAAPKPTDAPKPDVPKPTAAPVPTPLPVKNTLTITLKKGLKWSDGSAYTAKDIVGTYNVFWAQSDSIWTQIADVVAVNDTTVEFKITRPGPALLRSLLRSNNIRAYSQFAKFMDQAATLRKDNVDRKGDAGKAYLDDLSKFRPAEAVVSGPFNIDPKSVTEAQLTLKKNPNGYNADKIGFDSILVYAGETKDSIPLYLSGELDYSSNAYPPEAEKSILAVGDYMKIIRLASSGGGGMYFNNDVYPLGKKEVRQAFAYAINRAEVAKAALGESAVGIKYMAGFSDLAVPTWLPADLIGKLNTYAYDPAKAEALLKGLNFTKGADGIWVDDKGKKMEYEMIVPQDFIDYFNAAENTALQLKKFGIKLTVRGYPSAERNTVAAKGTFQISMDIGFRFGFPHPLSSYDYNIRDGIGGKNNPTNPEGSRGMNWPWVQKAADGKEVNIKDLVDKMGDGFDPEAQKPYVATVAQIFNDQLPVVTLFERYFNDPIDTKTRVTGWLPFTDPIYVNNQNDSPTTWMLIEGILKPSATNTKKIFTTSYPYIAPPKGHFNVFATDNIPLGLGSVNNPWLYTPLFFYSFAEGKYVPMLAEKYEIK
ncbi:MAG TPA: ABC transporter substrate-binding protein [Thermoflexales bacterium]|jgi:peptide/nickel transport system substrate-binding protein|nr:ABC transporter substrate-binding protein [Thermoflexales bacterium]HRA55464.1 ABC transporter substrate-binding protein [Thermoflexales bacterium]